MKSSVLVRIAGDSIRKNKMRTLLTMLGIVIGVGAVIIMVAVGQGAQRSIANQINALGTNLLVVTPGSSNAGGVSQGAGTFNRITVQDAEKLKSEGTLFAGVSPVVMTRTQVIAGGTNWRTISPYSAVPGVGGAGCVVRCLRNRRWAMPRARG